MTGSQLVRALRRRYPTRARPVGFYPLPTTRIEAGSFASRYHPFFTPAPRRGLLYIHVPFCRQRCAFCRFYPGPYREPAAQEYTDNVLHEARVWAALRESDPMAGPVEAVFFGGGSPSSLPPDQLHRLLTDLREALAIGADAEITMEWYPKDASAERFAVALACGVTRISFGIQSWHPQTIADLGSWHTADEADAALADVRAAGLDNVNIDLMLNVPGQRLSDAVADLERALAWQPAMVSVNPLEVAAGSPLAARAERSGFVESDTEKLDWLDHLRQRLFASGYHHQRARNFARPGRQHRYNAATRGIDYDIIPLGPGAYGFVGGWAVVNAIDLAAWASAAAGGGTTITGLAEPTEDEMRRSFAVTSMIELAVDPVAYSEQFDADLGADFPFVDELRELGALVEDGHRLTLSPDAAIFADDVCGEFSSAPQARLFSRHLKIGRSKIASQYFPVE